MAQQAAHGVIGVVVVYMKNRAAMWLSAQSNTTDSTSVTLLTQQLFQRSGS